jgi:hypothetical protein
MIDPVPPGQKPFIFGEAPTRTCRIGKIFTLAVVYGLMLS